MKKSQSSSKTSDATLSKLLEVDSDLVVQEAQLMARLASLQEKRKSLQSVIGIFSTSKASSNGVVEKSVEIPAVLPDKKPEPAVGDSDPSSVESAAKPKATQKNAKTSKSATPVAAESVEETTPSTKSKKAEKSTTSAKTKAPAATTATTKSTKTSKGGKTPKVRKTPGKPAATAQAATARSTRSSRRSEGWQKYMRQEYDKASLPDVVSTLIQQQPNEVLDIAHIVNAIFVEDMPKEARTKARDRISNILSAGARDNKWFRGKTGAYSFSRAAAEASQAS